MICPDCGRRRFKDRVGLGVHRRYKHGVLGKHPTAAQRSKLGTPMRQLFSPRGRKKNFDETGALHLLAGANWRKRRAA